MTCSHIRTFGVMYDHTLFCACKSHPDIRPYVKWAVSLVLKDGQLIFLRGLCGYTWVSIGLLTLLSLNVSNDKNLEFYVFNRNCVSGRLLFSFSFTIVSFC